jgi:flagellar FliJ protein
MNSLLLLQTLLQRAEADRDTALAVLRQTEALVQQAETQARQLLDYRSEYDQRWTARFRESGTTALLHCHRGFGQRLDQAIHHQTTNTDHLANRLKQARDVLLAREVRVASVRKLIERRQAELQKIAARRDQRNTDEAAQRVSAALASQGAAHPMAAQTN